jgi:hypothetical protein
MALNATLPENKPMDAVVNLWENNPANMSNKANKNFVYPDSTAGSKAAKRVAATIPAFADEDASRSVNGNGHRKAGPGPDFAT